MGPPPLLDLSGSGAALALGDVAVKALKTKSHLSPIVDMTINN